MPTTLPTTPLLLALAGCAAPAQRPALAEWLDALPSAGDVDAQIEARLDAADGTPLRDGDELVFLAPSSGPDAPQIVGDFNDGGFDPSSVLDGGRMARIGESDWYALRTSAPADARFEYLVRRGDVAALDPLNPRRTTTFGNERSVALGPDLRAAPAPRASDPRGTLETFTLTSEIRENERPVTVYLPPGYDPGGERLPTLYVKDGTRFRDELGVPSIVDALVARGRIAPVVVVFVDPIQRGLEYGTYGKYRRLVVEELVPEVERRYASGGDAARRGLLGASRGGLAVVDLVVQHPDVFGFCAAMSPALSPLPILDEIAAVERLDVRVLAMASRYDTPGLVRDAAALADALRGVGADVEFVEMPIDHSPLGWRSWVDVAITTWGAGGPVTPPTR